MQEGPHAGKELPLLQNEDVGQALALLRAAEQGVADAREPLHKTDKMGAGRKGVKVLKL